MDAVYTGPFILKLLKNGDIIGFFRALPMNPTHLLSPIKSRNIIVKKFECWKKISVSATSASMLTRTILCFNEKHKKIQSCKWRS